MGISMAVSGVGSSFSYIYNSKTGKLSSKDGSENEFTDYFNGNIEGKDSETLNGFDAGNKGSMKRLVELLEKGMIGKNILDSLNGDEYEISGEIVDAATFKSFAEEMKRENTEMKKDLQTIKEKVEAIDKMMKDI